MGKIFELKREKQSNYLGVFTLSPDIWIIISAIAQLERDLIAERVRNGLAAARARGKIIGRVRKRNSALIESLLEAGLSFRDVARVAKCSHGSVSAQKKEYLARKAAEEKAKRAVFEKDIIVENCNKQAPLPAIPVISK